MRNVQHLRMQVEWWNWCAKAFKDDDHLTSLGRSDSSADALQAFVAAANQQVSLFKDNRGLTAP